MTPLPDDETTSLLNMKPVSYQSMPSSLNGAHPNFALDRVLNTSNEMYRANGGFASADADAFKKQVVEHLRTRFNCFYCNSVSFSEAELNAHLKQHTTKYPFKCPHCGQGYMRRLCLVKHIERLHSKIISQGLAKSGITKNVHIPMSVPVQSVPPADPSLRPAVRVTVPSPSVAAIRLGKDEQRGKTLDSNVSNAVNGNAERLSPLNGFIQHNRALTVSLPDEVTIPAGCLVELVEVKTVNGTKELKLRLVTQQENESVIKDTRSTVSQSTSLGKPLSSTLNHPNTVNSVSMGMCTVSRKQCDTRTVNVERPAVVSVAVPQNVLNPVGKEKVGFKRTSPEIINLDCNTVTPNKITKTIFSPAREGNGGIRIAPREPVNLNAAAPTVSSPRISNRLTGSLHPDSMVTNVPQRAADERKKLSSEHSKSVLKRRANVTKNIPRDAPVSVKLEPREICFRDTTSKIMTEPVGLNQQNLKSASPTLNVPSAAEAQVRVPTILVCKDNTASNSTFSICKGLNEPSSDKTPVLANRTNSRISWPPDVRSNERSAGGGMPQPEGFPVISSVFSLSQQPEEVQGSIQPLVMALRGIVMDKKQSSHVSLLNSTEQMEEAPASRFCGQAGGNSRPISHNPLAEHTSDSIKVEELDKGIQHPPTLTDNHVLVKQETTSTTPTDNNKCGHTTDSKFSRDVESASAPHVDTNVSEDRLQQKEKSDHDDFSRFPTVSLKRVQVGVWKKSKKGLKLKISKNKTQVPIGSVTDCAVIYPMPLKVDQLVKRPGPYQPVVVLNHPKPRAPIQRARADHVADTGASEVAPKCQILKMRLSKVMGQKYEVMGCTVRIFP